MTQAHAPDERLAVMPALAPNCGHEAMEGVHTLMPVMTGLGPVTHDLQTSEQRRPRSRGWPDRVRP